MAAQFALIPRVFDIEDLQRVIYRKGAEGLKIARALTDEAILTLSETVAVDDSNDRFSQASLHRFTSFVTLSSRFYGEDLHNRVGESRPRKISCARIYVCGLRLRFRSWFPLCVGELN